MKLARHHFSAAPLWRMLALVGAFLGGTALCSRAATNGVLPYSSRVWQTDDGLPHNSVFAITQTRDGYLWVGTHEGLARFDGVRFTTIEAEAAPELRHGYITALCAGRDGSLWIAVDGSGVTRMKDGRFSHLTEADGLASNQTRCLLEARDGSLWIGSEGGLTRLRDDKSANFTQSKGLGDNSVRAVAETHDGTILIATKRGLSSLSTNGTITGTLTFGTNWFANSLKTAVEDRQGDLWIGSADGLDRVRGKERLLYSADAGLPDWVINVLYEDHAGQMWVGTYGGLARMVEGKVLPRSNSEAVFGDLVYAIFEDQEQNLWVGARDGLWRLNPARFTTYTTEEGLTRNNVMSVFEDHSGTLWLGIWDGGLNALRGGKVTAYGSPVPVQRDSVLSLRESRDGTLWVGMDLTGGLNQFRDGVRKTFPRPSGLINDAVRVIYEDRAGALWIGTSSGLNRYARKKCETFTTAKGLVADKVLAVCEDADGAVWFGTEGGLSRWANGHFTNFTTRDGLTHNVVDALYAAADRTLWAGTQGGGLNWVRAGKFSAITTRQGLFSDEVYEILEDDFGFFWMSCRRGIFRVARKELEEVARGARRTVTCTAFDKRDGLASVQCNGVAKPAGWKGQDGRLWFPTIRGVVAVQTRIKNNERPPPVFIETLLADRKLVPDAQWKGSPSDPSRTPLVSIPPGRGELEIHYTALSLQAPEKNLFKYKLEGADTTWSEAAPVRAAHYLNLTPGHYQFRVLASNNDGVWNETGASLALVLQPHYWQTWWFKGVVLAGVSGALTLWYRSRVARLREIERLRVEIAANLHDDVGARLTKVGMITEFVDQQTTPRDRLKPHVEAILRTTREVIQAMDEIVWTINPRNDTLDHLANYIFQYAQEYFQNTNLRCRLDLPAHLPDLVISTEVRHNVFMAVKEALNNVLKHAGAAEVRVSLAVTDSTMIITIADDGRGFAADQARAAGNGLQNMRQRLQSLGGRFHLETKPGAGTIIRMEAEAK
jgi:ligand-binding sensor domain-containing protein/signal transduction histidine kinase